MAADETSHAGSAPATSDSTHKTNNGNRGRGGFSGARRGGGRGGNRGNDKQKRKHTGFGSGKYVVAFVLRSRFCCHFTRNNQRRH